MQKIGAQELCAASVLLQPNSLPQTPLDFTPYGGADTNDHTKTSAGDMIRHLRQQKHRGIMEAVII